MSLEMQRSWKTRLDVAGDYLNDGDYRIEMNALRQLEGIADDKALNMALSRLYNLIIRRRTLRRKYCRRLLE